MTLTLSRLSGGGLLADDELIIRTVSGSKKISLMRNGETLSAIVALSRDSKWLQLDPGVNVIRISAPQADLGAFEITYDFSPLYEGI